MVLDSSAILSIVFEEPGSASLEAKIRQSAKTFVPAVALVESAIVLAGRSGTNPIPDLEAMADDLGMEVLDLDHAQSLLAINAFLQFGKGRHKAGLNFGDCMIYAAAKSLGEPLLFTGNDFSHTDIIAA